jgi:hypothetical protein
MYIHKISLFCILRANTLNTKQLSLFQSLERFRASEMLPGVFLIHLLGYLTYRTCPSIHLLQIKYIYAYVKVKVTPWHTYASTEGRQTYIFKPFVTSALERIGDKQASATLPSGKTQYPLYRRLVEIGAGLKGPGICSRHRDLIPSVSSS